MQNTLQPDDSRQARVVRILEGALRAWGVAGAVTSDEGAIVVAPQGGRHVAVQHDGARGWTITRRDPSTGAEARLAEHAGLPGLLRSLRAELAPEAPRGRLIVAAS